MTKQSLVQKLRKGQKKAISPVIATIILIAVALVLALLVGVFAFGLFSTNSNSVTMQSGTLVATGEVLTLSFKNPGSSNVAVTTVSLSGPPAISLSCTTGATVNAGSTLTVTCSDAGTGYAGTNAKWTASGTGMVSGNNYNYIVSLGNGQSISGTVVAQ
jgi:flagellin-like protein